MSLDLIIRNALARGTGDTSAVFDIGIQGGVIAAVAPGLVAEGETLEPAASWCRQGSSKATSTSTKP